MTLKPVHTFSFLSLAFLAFSFSIYLKPVFASNSTEVEKSKVAEGRLVWQKYNCQCCHQLYGLGGYLGPDLTNVYSNTGKGEPLIRAVLKTGNGTMPSFHLSEEETALLIAFLKATDTSGTADPRDFLILPSGMIQKK